MFQVKKNRMQSDVRLWVGAQSQLSTLQTVETLSSDESVCYRWGGWNRYKARLNSVVRCGFLSLIMLTRGLFLNFYLKYQFVYFGLHNNTVSYIIYIIEVTNNWLAKLLLRNFRKYMIYLNVFCYLLQSKIHFC